MTPPGGAGAGAGAGGMNPMAMAGGGGNMQGMSEQEQAMVKMVCISLPGGEMMVVVCESVRRKRRRDLAYGSGSCIDR